MTDANAVTGAKLIIYMFVISESILQGSFVHKCQIGAVTVNGALKIIYYTETCLQVIFCSDLPDITTCIFFYLNDNNYFCLK